MKVLLWLSAVLTTGLLLFVLGYFGYIAYFLYVRPKLKKEKWSIGIYTGFSPLNLKPSAQVNNPVLTAQDIKDVDARFIADPFIIREEPGWFLFFEVFNNSTQKGEIGCATSHNSLNWQFERIVLSEPFHLSYPHVFKWENEYYMIPESYQAGSVRLYKAAPFPFQWKYQKNLLEKAESDASVFFYANRWWMFTVNHWIHQLNLYHADTLYGPWTEHPRSPLLRNNEHIARPGGRVTFFDGKLIRFAQDDWLVYGNRVRAFEITKLSETEYEEQLLCKKPVLSKTGVGWNRSGMHHLDPFPMNKDLWIAAVDGLGVTGSR